MHTDFVFYQTPQILFISAPIITTPLQNAGLARDDPDLNIAWPVKSPILSSKDLENATLREIQATDLVRYAK